MSFTWLLILLMSCNVNSQCISSTLNGIEVKTTVEHKTDTDPLSVTVYNNLEIYQCTINPTVEDTYHSCTTAYSCCTQVGTYCDSINNGRVIISNPGADVTTIEEIILLTKNNDNSCNNINYAIMNWCIDNATFNGLTTYSQSKQSGLPSHCTPTQIHVTALYLSQTTIPTIESNFLKGDFTSRPYKDATGFEVKSQICPPVTTSQTEETQENDNNLVSCSEGILLTWNVMYIILAAIFALSLMFGIYKLHKMCIKSKVHKMENRLEFQKTKMKNVCSDTAEISNTNNANVFGDTIFLDKLALDTIPSNAPCNNTFKRCITPQIDMDNENGNEKSVLGLGINVDEFESQTKQQSHHGLMNDSVTVTQTDGTTNNTCTPIGCTSKVDTLENILMDVMNTDIPENSEFVYIDDRYNIEEKSITVDIRKDNSNNSNNSQQINNIKLVLYDFDQTITTIHLYKELNGKDMNEFKISDERLVEIFGGKNRIERLHKHFRYLMSNNIKLGILSFGLVEIINNALDRINMLKYFSFVVGRNSNCNKQISQKKGMKGMYIKNLMKNDNYKKNEILFIDDDPKNIQLVDKLDCCQTMLIQPRIGMNQDHFKYVEDNYVH